MKCAVSRLVMPRPPSRPSALYPESRSHHVLFHPEVTHPLGAVFPICHVGTTVTLAEGCCAV